MRFTNTERIEAKNKNARDNIIFLKGNFLNWSISMYWEKTLTSINHVKNDMIISNITTYVSCTWQSQI